MMTPDTAYDTLKADIAAYPTPTREQAFYLLGKVETACDMGLITLERRSELRAMIGVSIEEEDAALAPAEATS